jgi:hypothetical protein
VIAVSEVPPVTRVGTEYSRCRATGLFATGMIGETEAFCTEMVPPHGFTEIWALSGAMAASRKRSFIILESRGQRLRPAF